MNKVILMGRITADPELRQTQSGISAVRFNLAVNRKFANKETGEREADFISCQAWRNTAEFISKYFRKGSMICVEGSLRTGSYTDRTHSDVTHYTTDVIVDNAEFCGGKSDNQGQSQQSAPQQTAQNNETYNDLSGFEEILSDGDTPF